MMEEEYQGYLSKEKTQQFALCKLLGFCSYMKLGRQIYMYQLLRLYFNLQVD